MPKVVDIDERRRRAGRRRRPSSSPGPASARRRCARWRPRRAGRRARSPTTSPTSGSCCCTRSAPRWRSATPLAGRAHRRPSRLDAAGAVARRRAAPRRGAPPPLDGDDRVLCPGRRGRRAVGRPARRVPHVPRPHRRSRGRRRDRGRRRAPKRRAEQLIAVADGIAVQALFDPAGWPRRRQLRRCARPSTRCIAPSDSQRARHVLRSRNAPDPVHLAPRMVRAVPFEHHSLSSYADRPCRRTGWSRGRRHPSTRTSRNRSRDPVRCSSRSAPPASATPTST